jgi:hypothetical protein
MKHATSTDHEAEIDQLRAEQERALERIARMIQWIDQLLEQERREQAAHELRMRCLSATVDLDSPRES